MLMASDHLPLVGDRIVPRNGFRWLAQHKYYLAIGALGAGVVGWNLYRACQLSITHDEALTYLYYVAKGPRSICSREGYCANNHILYSLLAWCSVQLFGVSEFALRLPSVLAGGLFVLGAGRLFGQLAGRTLLAWTGVLVLTLNPLIMDFLVAARGYGLGLTLSIWAWSCLVATLAAVDGPASRKTQMLNWLASGTVMGLAVGANLTFLFPNLTLAIAFLGVKLGTDRINRVTALRDFVLWFAVPGALWTALLCYPVIRHVAAAGSSNAGATDAHFYYGSASFFQTTQSILVPMLQAVPEKSWLPLAANDPAWTAITYGVMIAFFALLAPLLYVLHRLIRNPQSRDDEWSRQYALLAGGAAGLLGLLWLLNTCKGTPLPRDRTGLYFAPLMLALLVLIVGKCQKMGGWIASTSKVVPLLLLALAAHFATQAQADFFYVWRYDAGTKRAYHHFADEAENHHRSLRVGYEWIFEPGLVFYRQLSGREIFSASLCTMASSAEPFDGYYLGGDTALQWEAAGKLRVIWRDPISGAKIAVPRSP